MIIELTPIEALTLDNALLDKRHHLLDIIETSKDAKIRDASKRLLKTVNVCINKLTPAILNVEDVPLP